MRSILLLAVVVALMTAGAFTYHRHQRGSGEDNVRVENIMEHSQLAAEGQH